MKVDTPAHRVHSDIHAQQLWEGKNADFTTLAGAPSLSPRASARVTRQEERLGAPELSKRV